MDSSVAIAFGALSAVARDLERGQRVDLRQAHHVVAYYCVSESGSDPVMLDVLDLKAEQARAIVEGEDQVLGALEVDPDHVRRLAEAYLARARGARRTA